MTPEDAMRAWLDAHPARPAAGWDERPCANGPDCPICEGQGLITVHTGYPTDETCRLCNGSGERSPA
jgi:DnaJ-class molecular chaperone